MSVDQNVIKRMIGGPTKRFSIAVDRMRVHGFMSLKPTNTKKAEKQVLTNQDFAESLGIRLFCGYCADVVESLRAEERGVYLYAIGNIDEDGIIALCKVGTPSAYVSPDAVRAEIQHDPTCVFAQMIRSGRWTVESLADPFPPSVIGRRVRIVLRRIFERHPFRIYFADHAGLKARFLNSVPPKEAAWISKQIEAIDLDASDAVEPLSMQDFIVKRQTLRLWWD
jgi:hypothetical protein